MNWWIWGPLIYLLIGCAIVIWYEHNEVWAAVKTAAVSVAVFLFVAVLAPVLFPIDMYQEWRTK